jgi:RHS repeat-associated protein
MRSGRILRWSIILTAGIGLFLSWSSHFPPFDLEAWRHQQLATQAEAAAPKAPPAVTLLAGQPTPTAVPSLGAIPAPATMTPPPPENGVLSVDCDPVSPGVQGACSYSVGQAFTVDLQAGPAPVSGYGAFQLALQWSAGLSYQPSASAADEALWPNCTYPLRSTPDDLHLTFACAPFPELAQPSTYTGSIARLQMQCTADADVPLALIARTAPGSGSFFVGTQLEEIAPAVVGASIRCGAGSPATSTPTTVASPTPGGSPTPTATPTGNGLAPPGTVDETDISTTGGTIASRDGRVSINLPSQAVSEPLHVKITSQASASLTPILDHAFVSAWQFDAFATNRAMARVSSFPADVTITVNYTEQDLLGRNPDTLRFWTWNEADNRWDELPSEHVPNSGTVIVHVNHFSLDAGTSDPAVLQPAFLRAYQTNLQTGASNVTVPITVPPGRNGLTPNLNLSYSSDRVNEMKSAMNQGSWLGVGWDLDVGSIRKEFPVNPQLCNPACNPRYFIDLNGVSDELVQGSDLKWRTRHEQFLRVQQNGSCDVVSLTPGTVNPSPTPPCSWIVTDKHGTTFYFGATTSGADASAARYYDYYWGAPYYQYKLYYYDWDLRVVVDTHNNYVAYGYLQQILSDNPGGTAPCCQPWVFAANLSQIIYDGSQVVINFGLGDDGVYYQGFPNIPLRNDSPRNLGSCHIPNKAEETRRLDAIDVLVSGQRTRRYAMHYVPTTSFTVDGNCNGTAGVLQLDWLKQLDNSGVDSDATTLYKMQFNYATKHFGIWVNPNGTEAEYGSFDRIFLAQATNGFGGSTTYSYDARRITPLPMGQATWSREVVTQQTLSAGVGGVSDIATSYTYNIGPAYFVPKDQTNPNILDYRNEEYRGFAEVIETREPGSGGALTYHEFNTTGTYLGATTGTSRWDSYELMTGHEYQTRIYDGGGAVFWRQVDSTWQASCVDPNPAYCTTDAVSAFVSLVSVDTNEERSSPVTLRTEYGYDNFGNVFCERHSTNAVPDRTVLTPYVQPASPGDSWVFVPQAKLVYQGGTCAQPVSLAASTGYYYDGFNVPFPSMPAIGNLTAVQRSDLQTTAQYSDVYYGYDTFGNKTVESVAVSDATIISTVVPTGGAAGPNFSSWGYDGTLAVYPIVITNQMAHVTNQTWDLRMGTLTLQTFQFSTNPIYHTVSNTYDSFGRLTYVYQDNNPNPTTHNTYFWSQSQQFNGINSTLTQHFNSNSAPNNNTWESHCFDGFGREVQSRRSFTPQPLGSDSLVETSYTARGLTAYQTAPFPASHVDYGLCTGPLLGTSSNKSYTQYSNYNPLDEPQTVTTHDGVEHVDTYRQSDHNGLTTLVQDENNHQMKYWNDGLGRLTRVTEYTGNSPATYQPYAVTNYQYDTLDNLTLVIDGQTDGYPTCAGCHQGNGSAYRYDGMGRKVEMWDADLGHWTYAYDAAGNLTQQQDARGLYVSMTYDLLNRMRYKCYTTTCNPASAVASYTYDAYDAGAGCPGNANTATGHMTTMAMTDQSTNTKWCYDSQGHQTKELKTIGATTQEIDHAYDPIAGRLTGTTYPDGEVLSLSYDDANGQPKQLNSNLLSAMVSSVRYDAAFRMTSETMSTGQPTNYTYNGRGWVKTIQTNKPGGGFVQDVSYSYDAAGNVGGLVDNVAPTDNLTFGYDELNRLTSVSGSYTATYEYDRIGNTTRITEGTGATELYPLYGPQRKPHAPMVVLNKPLTDPTVDANAIVRAYDYDANGNRVGYATGSRAQTVDSSHGGCSNGNKLGTDKYRCGKRNPANFWDSMDLTHDCKGTVADILAVVQRSGTNDANGTATVNRYSDPTTAPPATGYHPAFDRAELVSPPNAWNLGPAEGIVSVADILAAQASFGATNIRPDGSPGCNTGADATFPTKYTYDNENRLTSVVDTDTNTTTVSYVYDGQGKLVQKTVNGSTTAYWGDIYENSSATGVTKYYSFGGRRVAMRSGATLNFLTADKLNSTTALLDTSGNIAGSGSQIQKYYPFGNLRTGSVSTDKLFTGQQYTSGLYLMGSRSYGPVVGKFLQPDTIIPDLKNPQSLNRYSYALNNPLRYTDPTGHDPLDTCGGGYCLPCFCPGPERPPTTYGPPNPQTPIPPPVVVGQELVGEGPAPWPIIALGIAIYLCQQTHCGQAIVQGTEALGGAIGSGARTACNTLTFGLFCSSGGESNGNTPQVQPQSAPKTHVPPTSDDLPWAQSPEPPFPGWVWNGEGPAGSPQGAWENPETGETLHPDLVHNEPRGPHWTYQDEHGRRSDIFPDGRIEYLGRP